MTKTSANLAIMFADIAGSTRLYETLGDARARQITSECINLLIRLTREYQGTLIKTIGDEVMCTFPDANFAADAALRMQEEVSNQAAASGANLAIRVGFHYGPVIQEAGDVFGDAVNLAARMAAQAKAQQIITTRDTIDMLDAGIRNNSRIVDRTMVKGKAKPLEIYELIWGEEEDLTIMGGSFTAKIDPFAKASAAFKVSFRGQVVEVTEAAPTVTMGRGNQNRLVVPDTMASRQHARIEFRKGKFFLVDQSTNGTYVFLIEEGKKVFLRREETPLEADGVIGLGKEVTPDSQFAVHFNFN